MELGLALLFGLCIGSFLNVCIARLPLNQSVITPRSHCLNCNHLIAWYDNLPLVSYLSLHARCRHCNVEISGRYPAIEALTALLSLLIFVQHGIGTLSVLYLFFCSAMLVLIMIDLDHRILPDVITLNGIWISVLMNIYLALPSPSTVTLFHLVGVEISSERLTSLYASLIGLFCAAGLFWLVREAFFLIRGIEGMGVGDIKMIAMVGAFLGLPLTLLTILISSTVGSVLGLTVIRVFRKSRNYELPFGTFLGMGAIISLLYGKTIINFYLKYAFSNSTHNGAFFFAAF